MKLRTFYSELAYLLGLFSLALGTALMEAADFGMSMVVAPAYILYRRFSQFLPFLTFGMTEYLFQALLLVFMCILLRKFHLRYLLAFVTAILYGFLLDASIAFVSLFSANCLPIRLVFFALGLVCCSTGVAMLFHTYLSPEVYELFVKEFSEAHHIKLSRCKTCYDIISCLVALLMSFLFFGFGHFVGVKLGTVICALANGFLIGRCSILLERRFRFVPKFHRVKSIS